jgi:hypothetical protein
MTVDDDDTFVEFRGVGAPPGPVGGSRDDFELALDDFPPGLRSILVELESWVEANTKDAKRDTIAFWSLKGPAILTSSSAGLWAYFDLTPVAVVLSTLASMCILIDGLQPRGLLRNAHVRAVHDLRLLMSEIADNWRSRDARRSDSTVEREIIKWSQVHKAKIAKTLREAESTLNLR